MTLPPLPPGEFPGHEALARALFEEAARHLEDAHILHVAMRYPGSITSAMKAAELGIKSIAVADGAMGWFDKLFQEHKILTTIETHPVLMHRYAALENYNRLLPREIKAMERLVPSRLGSDKLDISNVANTEYPFFAVPGVPGSGHPGGVLYLPNLYFTVADSKQYYDAARAVLIGLQTISPVVQTWGVPLSPSV